MFNNSLTAQIAEFLNSIGITTRAAELLEPTFLPGVKIDRGELVVDESRLAHPGDVLHEAGHIAVMPPHIRTTVSGDVGADGGAEMSATAWAYAAAVHLGLHSSIIFHEDSYRGGSSAMISNFEAGRYIGVPYLQWVGLTVDAVEAKKTGARPYPSMVRWLR